MTKQSRVTKGSDWRMKARKSELVPLPSGNVVRLRPVAVDVLIAQGKIPEQLRDLAAQTLFNEVEFEKIAEEGKASRQYVELINSLMPACFVEPAVVPKAEADDEIELSDIDWQDKVFVFQLALLPTEALRSFRPKQGSDVDSLSDVEGNVDTGK